MAEEFTIDIETNGNVTFEGHGISGPDCVKLPQAIMEALGTVTKQTLKPDYRRTNALLNKKRA